MDDVIKPKYRTNIGALERFKTIQKQIDELYELVRNQPSPLVPRYDTARPLDHLHDLFELLRESGVTHFQDGQLTVTLGPKPLTPTEAEIPAKDISEREELSPDKKAELDLYWSSPAG